MYINKMGIELEGAWKGTKGVVPFTSGTRIKHDGSVHFSQPLDGTFLHYGEVVSEPLEPEELKEWAREHCPTRINSSCGTHIHVSLKSNGLYGCILNPGFQKALLLRLNDYNQNTLSVLDEVSFHLFKERLAGRNRYCKKGYNGLSQVILDSKGSERYHQLNYCHRLRGTLEIRVLPPTTNPAVLCDLIDIVTNTIEEWCRKEHRTEKVRFRRA